uniref:tetratricopeptide repeat protein n=1 Tax=uncultured Sphingomonas sp. TaxID=158754 RepID=UPI0025DDFD2B|nr:tetratricopeptide repeat protein [uncultured Sphingomonas sp.]
MASLPKCLRQASLGALLIGSVAGCAGGTQRGTDVASRLRIASVAEASGQPEVAMSVLNSLANSAPDNVEVQARYARALARTGRVPDAEAAATQALRRKPGDPVLLVELGRIRLLEGKAAEAAEAFRAVLAARPREVGAMVGRGIAHDLLGQHTEAQASYRTALAADPQNLPALNNLALSMVLAGDPGGALAVLGPLAARGDAPARVRNNLTVAQAAANEQSGLPPAPVAAAAPRYYQDAPPRAAAVAATVQREAPQQATHADRNAATPVAFAPGATPTLFTDGVVAMEPIPDRQRRAKPAPKASNERATATTPPGE